MVVSGVSVTVWSGIIDVYLLIARYGLNNHLVLSFLDGGIFQCILYALGYSTILFIFLIVRSDIYDIKMASQEQNDYAEDTIK